MYGVCLWRVTGSANYCYRYYGVDAYHETTEAAEHAFSSSIRTTPYGAQSNSEPQLFNIRHSLFFEKRKKGMLNSKLTLRTPYSVLRKRVLTVL